MQSCEKIYKLQLGDGYKWSITSTCELGSWLSEFAGIMGLSEGNGRADARLTFTGIHRDSPSGNLAYVENPRWKIYRQPSLNLLHDDNLKEFVCEIDISKNDGDMKLVNMLISLQAFYIRAIENGGLPFHAALIERDGKGIIIAGHGDAGKSTCARRLEGIWTPLCDDEALVVLDKGVYRAHPFPTWSDYIFRDSGKAWDAEYSVPLSAVFFLEQAQRDEVMSLSAADAALLINSSAMQVSNYFYRDMQTEEKRKHFMRVFDNACRLAKEIPAFILRASRDGKFWEEVEKVIR